MPLEHPNITLGTAGHIDHGKTALIKFLTGCDTDRLREEKERGMSIDLGYAPCTLGGLQVGIVDVPGHEHFIKTMVAGASAMDGVILVVAADDGVMPQTREHLEILALLGVRHGVVALTKTDLVGADGLALAEDDVREFLRGTFLEGAPVLPMCSLTGEGFEPFYEALAGLVRAVEPRRTDGVFRLPVDRAFSAKGYGTVVAGVPVAGTVRPGDEVVLLPQGWTGHVRGAEVYGRPADTVLAGQCAALNVRRWRHREIGRGDVVTAPGCFTPSRWYACELRLLPRERLRLKNGEQMRFHTGTSEVTASVYLMGGRELRAGQTALVQVRTEAPVVAGPADRFIVRRLSPPETVGGGMIIEAIPRRLRRTRPGIVEDLADRACAVREGDFVEYCLRMAEGLVTDAQTLALRAKLPRGQVARRLAQLVQEGRASAIGEGLYVHEGTAASGRERAIALVDDRHARRPQSPGIGRDELRRACGLPDVLFEAVLGELTGRGELHVTDGRVARRDHRVEFAPDDQRLLDAVESAFREGGLRPPRASDVLEGAEGGKERAQWALRTLTEHGRIIEVAEGLVFHRDAVERAGQALRSHIEREGRLESVEFKYLLDTTRKFAIPLLDYFDRVGLTRRVGHTRYLAGKGAGKDGAPS